MGSSRLSLILVCVMSLFSLVTDKASAQLLKNTPFDPGTWNPRDWVKTPAPPRLPKAETIVVRNRSTDTLHFAYGNDHFIAGWATVRPGQSTSRKIYISHGKGYLLVERRGKKLRIGNRRTHYVPYHPKKRFSIRYEGRGDYKVSINGKKLGVFSKNSLKKLGFSGAHFAEVPIRNGGTYTFTVD